MALLLNNIVAKTGSSRGIGRACAMECKTRGERPNIALPRRRRYFESLRTELTDHVESVIVPEDIGEQETSTHIIREGVKAFGRLNVLVSDAGICPFWGFLSMPKEVWERTRQVNLDGSFFIVQAPANQMKLQEPQGGAIVTISSISALVGGELQCHYTPTKAEKFSLMHSCAVALGGYNVRCNAILPGTVATDINKEDLADPKKRKYIEQRTVLGRSGTPDDIAGPVVFLASDLAKYITGAGLLVDGGLFVNFQ